jgi:hypothetical protein
MLEFKAILNDFATHNNMVFELEEYVYLETEITSSVEPKKFECEVTTTYKGRPLRMSLTGTPTEPAFRSFGVAPTLTMFTTIGYISEDAIEVNFVESAIDDYPEFFNPDSPDSLEIIQWDDDGYRYVGLQLSIGNLFLGDNFFDLLSYYLLRLQVACENLLTASLNSIERFKDQDKFNYHKHVWLAAKSYDRVFFVAGNRYLESCLEPFDWSENEDLELEDGQTPPGFQESEFTQTALWLGKELLALEEIRSRVFDLVATELSKEGVKYEDEEQMLWVVHNEIVTANSIFMSINSGLSFGSRRFFRIPEGAPTFEL